RRRTGGAGLLPSVSRRIVASAGIQEDVAETAPHDHLCARPYRRVQAASAWHIHGAGRQPAIGLRVVTSSVVVELEVVVEPSPENHFLPGPNRSYALTIGRRVGRIGRSPGVGRGVIASTGRHGRGASLDDHFASTPDRRVHPAEGRRTGHAGWGPGIRGRVIAGAA